MDEVEQMAFTVEDIRDLLEILRQRPEWRAELLGALLGEEFLSLPAQFRGLAEAHQRTEAEIAVLSAEVRALAEAQRRSEEQFASYRAETNRRFAELAAQVRALAEAQRRTEQRVEELAEAQRQTDQTVRELVEAQRQTDQRLNELAEAQRRTEQRLDELAEFQRRAYEEFVAFRSETDQRLTRLERGQQRLEVAVERLQREVRNLSNTIGMTVEDEAEDMVAWVLKKRGYAIRRTRQSAIIDGEVDVIVLATTPEGQDVTVVVEVKHRLGVRDVYRWAQRVQSKSYQRRLSDAGYAAPYMPYIFAMRFDDPALEATRALGIGLVNSRGEQVEGSLLVRGGVSR
jgi:arsenate reductase-like glutaredoxin family protein